MTRLQRVLAVVAAVLAVPAAAAPPPVKPKLYVVISMDQFSGALFSEYRGRFTGGLGRMTKEGVVFPSGYQSHAASETCPGHSTLLTGRHPAATGIIGNSWYSSEAGQNVYCVYDPAGRVPGRDNAPRGAAFLKASTFGEWLKAADPKSRNFAVSGKDRAAITMAGRNADGTFWWDDERGFTTSVPDGTTEAARLAPVVTFNTAYFASWKAAGAPGWGPRDARCGPAAPSTFGSLVIDHTIPPAGWTTRADFASFADEPDFKRRFRASPALDKVTLALAAQLIDREKLGRGPAPDVLSVSLSATDYVGHRYGSEGPEMCQQLVEIDAALGVFFTKLAALKLPVVVVLTADHGSIDAAERAAERGFPARRFSAERVVSEVGTAVAAQLKLDFDPLAGDANQLTITSFGDPDPAQKAAIETAALAALRARPEVAAVFTKAEVLAAKPPKGKPSDELTLIERFALSTDPIRSGDIIIAYQPYASGGDPRVTGDYVAGHGSPWNYDRRVPMLFWWPGATGFEQPLPVETVDIAPTLAAIAGVPAPEIDGRCLDLDGGTGDSCAAR